MSPLSTIDPMKTPIALLTFLAAIGTGHATTLLFADTFDRSDSANIDGSVSGISGTIGSTFTADTVYTQPFVDPANESSGPDGAASNGGGAQISGNRLQLAVGAGTSNAYINHNFTDAAITSAGGMSITLDVPDYGGTARQHGGGFAIGMSQVEADSARDAFNIVDPSMMGAYPGDPYGVTGDPVAPSPPDPNADYIVSDFWIGVRGNESLAWGSNTGNVLGLGQGDLAQKTGTIRVDFFFSDFNAGSTVNYEVFFDGGSVGTGNFQWSENNQNYIGLDGRSGAQVSFDNLSISTIPEPSIALLGGLGLLGLLRRRR